MKAPPQIPADDPNPYGLPGGGPIRKQLKEWFARQRREILGTLAQIGAELPLVFTDLADYNDPMASAMTPILGAYYNESGRKTMARLGLDPDEWKVSDPNVRTAIEHRALEFCAETNAKTSLDLNVALERLRRGVIEGLVQEGEAPRQLRQRVMEIFDGAEEWRAQRIAMTEAAAAVHTAQLMSAGQSGVVAGMELLISGDACPLCQRVATEAKAVRLGYPFLESGTNPTYRFKRMPPLHPSCQCTAIEVLKPEYGGPVNPDWRPPVVDPPAEEVYEPPAGQKIPKPEPQKLKKPKPAVKQQPVEPTPPPPPPPLPVVEEPRPAPVPVPEPQPQPTARPIGRVHTPIEDVLSGQPQSVDNADLSRHMRAEFGEWDRKLPEEQREAIEAYTNTGYISIASDLRKGKTDRPYVKEIDEAIESHPGISEDTLVYRGVYGREAYGLPRGSEAVGLVGEEKGFMSTSIRVRTSAAFAQKPVGWADDLPDNPNAFVFSDDSAMLRITIPKGTKAGTGLSGEFEYILARGTKFRITGYAKMGDLHVYDAEVIP